MGLVWGRREILCRDFMLGEVLSARGGGVRKLCRNHWSWAWEGGVQLPADAVLGAQRTLEQLWGRKIVPDAIFYLAFSGLLILRSCLNPHSVFHKNGLLLSLSWIYWKPASKISINLNIFMMPFYSLFFSILPCSYFCHFFKPFSAFSKSYSFSQVIIKKSLL